MSETTKIVIEYKKDHHASIEVLLTSLKRNKKQESLYQIYLWGHEEERFAVEEGTNVKVRWIDTDFLKKMRSEKVIFLKWNTLVLGDLTDFYETDLEGFDCGAVRNFPDCICILPSNADKYSEAVLLTKFNDLPGIMEYGVERTGLKIKDLSILYNLGIEELMDKQGAYDKNKLMENAGFSQLQIPSLLHLATIVRFQSECDPEKYFDGILSELWLKYYKMSFFHQNVIRRNSYVETIGEIQLDSGKESVPVMISVNDDNADDVCELVSYLKTGIAKNQKLDIRGVYTALSEENKYRILSAVSGQASVILYNTQKIERVSPCYDDRMIAAGVFDEYSKIIYLKPEKLRLDAIGDLYHQDIGNCYMKAVFADLDTTANSEENILNMDARVLLLNTDRWLMENMSIRVWESSYLCEEKENIWKLSVEFLCRGACGWLPTTWRYQLIPEEFNEAEEESENMEVKRYVELENENIELKNRVCQLQDELGREKENSKQYLYELTETRTSFTYKIGRFMTWLPRKIRR